MGRTYSPRRLAARQRTLQILAWGIGVFLAVQLGAGLALDRRWPEVRFPQAARVFERLEEMPRSPQIICLGSSRFESALSEDLLDSLLRLYTRPAPRLMNAAVGAGDAMVAEWMLERMLAKGYRPEMLLIEVLPENLAARALWVDEQVVRQMTWADVPGCVLSVCRYGHPRRLLTSRLLPLYTHRYQLRKELAEAIGDSLETGSHGPSIQYIDIGPIDEAGLPSPPPAIPELPPGTPPHSTKGLPFFATWLKDYEIAGIMPAALQRLLTRCETEGITVLLVAPPVDEAHARLYTPAIEAAFLEYIQSIESRHGCHFVDYRRRVPEHGFIDTHHVNVEGATYFSWLFAREVLIPAWRERD